MKIHLAQFSWPEIAEIQKKKNVIILPIGSTEQHGPHLPLEVDSYCPKYIAENVAFEAEREGQISVLVAPAIHYTEVATFEGYPGSIGVSVDTTANYILEIVESFIKNGFNNILILNGHSSNMIPINTALRKANIKYNEAGLYAINWWSIGTDTIKKMLKSKPCLHAEELETSVYMSARPDLVNMDKAYSEYPSLSLTDKWVTADFYGLGKHVFYHSRKKYPQYGKSMGVMGDATTASRETGKIIAEAVVKDLYQIIEEIIQSEQNI